MAIVEALNRGAAYLMAEPDDRTRTEVPEPVAAAGAVAGSRREDITDEVLERFRSGDRDALGEIYRLFCRPVWGVAMTVLHDRQLAEDSVTETFLRAWRAAPSFDPSRPLAPWLFTLARRCAIDVQRREFRPTRGGHAPEEDGVVEMPDISAAYEAWEVRSAVSQLPPEEQSVVRLSHLEGLTHVEIAQQLGVPLGTVKSRSHRAHRRLADRLRHLRTEEGR